MRRIGLLCWIAGFAALGSAGIWLDLQAAKGDVIGDVVFGTWLGATFAVGLLILWHNPRHPVGVLLGMAATGVSAAMTAKSYASAASTGAVDLPAADLAAWFSHWSSLPAAGLFLFAMILFPDGHLPSKRWKWVAGVLAGALAFGVVGLLFDPGPIDGVPSISNPFGTGWGQALYNVSQAGQTVIAIVVVALVASLIIRSRKGSPQERQQIKWVAYAIAIIPVAIGLSAIAQEIDKSDEDWLGFGLIVAGLLALPIGIGIAILRYRLYDVDLVVNRTIVYVLLTAFLGGAYVGGIALIQTIVPIGENNDLAVAASTLAIAALFQPARRRIQGFIDHYFYRRRYDAQRTIADFSYRLRDEIDLDALNDELVKIVTQTMQPSHLSVWLLSDASEEPA